MTEEINLNTVLVKRKPLLYRWYFYSPNKNYLTTFNDYFLQILLYPFKQIYRILRILFTVVYFQKPKFTRIGINTLYYRNTPGIAIFWEIRGGALIRINQQGTFIGNSRFFYLTDFKAGDTINIKSVNLFGSRTYSYTPTVLNNSDIYETSITVKSENISLKNTYLLPIPLVIKTKSGYLNKKLKKSYILPKDSNARQKLQSNLSFSLENYISENSSKLNQQSHKNQLT